jgi:hypothetical protein
MTAQQLMERLRSDPHWVAAEASRDARYAERSERLRVDQAPLLADLATAGVHAASVYDFVNGRPTPSEAFPVLVRHLDAGHLPPIREGIIRSLSTPPRVPSPSGRCARPTLRSGSRPCVGPSRTPWRLCPESKNWPNSPESANTQRYSPNLALQRTPATGRALSFVQAHWSVAGSAELCL